MSIQRYLPTTIGTAFTGMKPAVEGGDYVLYTDHAAEVARLTVERDAAVIRAKAAEFTARVFSTAHDAAVARAERAEGVAVTVCNIVDRLKLKFSIQRNVNFTGGAVVQEFAAAKEELVATLAAAQDANPAYRALEPEPWGGPKGEE